MPDAVPFYVFLLFLTKYCDFLSSCFFYICLMPYPFGLAGGAAGAPPASGSPSGLGRATFFLSLFLNLVLLFLVYYLYCYFILFMYVISYHAI